VSDTVKGYKVVGLTPHNTVITVDAINGRHDTGDKPSEFGLWGLTAKERAILRRGLTAAGKDRATPRPAPQRRA
jgi:hypothetical protein